MNILKRILIISILIITAPLTIPLVFIASILCLMFVASIAFFTFFIIFIWGEDW